MKCTSSRIMVHCNHLARPSFCNTVIIWRDPQPPIRDHIVFMWFLNINHRLPHQDYFSQFLLILFIFNRLVQARQSRCCLHIYTNFASVGSAACLPPSKTLYFAFSPHSIFFSLTWWTWWLVLIKFTQSIYWKIRIDDIDCFVICRRGCFLAGYPE